MQVLCGAGALITLKHVKLTTAEVSRIYRGKLLQEAQLSQRDRLTRCQLKSCQMLHKCTQNPIWKGLQYVNDLEGHSRSSDLPLFDKPYITSFLLVIYSNNVSIRFRDITTFTAYVTPNQYLPHFLSLETVKLGISSFVLRLTIASIIAIWW